MNYKDLFEKYGYLVGQADQAFAHMAKEYGDNIVCKAQCADCCHSIFGLFPIEAAYISHQFGKLDRKLRREALSQAEKADKELLSLEQRLQKEYGNDQEAMVAAIAKERVRCPLLNEQDKCMMYGHRPVTCRVYGMPTVVGGKPHACWKGNFLKGHQYPSFNLDAMYHELYGLSKEFLDRMGQPDPETAGLLLSVSKSIATPVEELF